MPTPQQPDLSLCSMPSQQGSHAWCSAVSSISSARACVFCNSAASLAAHTIDLKIDRALSLLPGPNACTSALLELNQYVSLQSYWQYQPTKMHSLRHDALQTKAVAMLSEAAELCDDDTRLQRIIPYMLVRNACSGVATCSPGRSQKPCARIVHSAKLVTGAAASWISLHLICCCACPCRLDSSVVWACSCATDHGTGAFCQPSMLFGEPPSLPHLSTAAR